MFLFWLLVLWIFSSNMMIFNYHWKLAFILWFFLVLWMSQRKCRLSSFCCWSLYRYIILCVIFFFIRLHNIFLVIALLAKSSIFAALKIYLMNLSLYLISALTLWVIYHIHSMAWQPNSSTTIYVSALFKTIKSILWLST